MEKACERGGFNSLGPVKKKKKRERKDEIVQAIQGEFKKKV
jgi:hypothetical protein